jgi:biotin carboxyl carrier protein
MALETMEAPLPGKILKVSVKAGDKVSEGDEVCTIESMKMENPILAPVSGTVKEIKVSAGMIVKAGDTIAAIEY